MRCLILGASGQLGSQLAAACEIRGLPWLGTSYTEPDPFHAPLDLRDSDATRELLADYQPDCVFLAADPGTLAIEQLAKSLRFCQSRLVFFSSADVMGECRTARKEDAALVGTGRVAQSKIDQERAIQQTLPDQHLIVRTSWLFGPGGGPETRLNSWIDQWNRGEVVHAAQDRQGQPTYTPDLAAATLELASQGNTERIHLVGPDRSSEFSFARLAAHLLGFDMDLVEARSATDLDANSELPRNPWLDRGLMRQRVGSQAIRRTADALRQLRHPAWANDPRLLRAA